jgi:PleD family two-component response regulator
MKLRITISVDEHLAKKIAELAERSGLSSSAVVNTCLHYALPNLENGSLLNSSAVTRSRRAVSILLVEDSQPDAELVVHALHQADYEPRIRIVQTAEEMEKALRGGSWDFVLADWILPELSGLEALEIHRKCGSSTPIIIVSGRIGEEAIVEAMRSGADDCVLKDRLETLVPAMERILTRKVMTASRGVSFANGVSTPRR